MATKKAATKNAASKTKKSQSTRAKKVASSPSSASNAIDQQLGRYREMRDFKITSEPSGSPKGAVKNTKSVLPFVIQKHAASHLHYDFRLGWNGVLKSWAIAKGPSYVTTDKRLAVQVEDHPMEYGGFEGIIPQGQYGGGTVMLWDEGTWEPQAAHPDIDEGLRTGSLKFTLHGTKMKGNWALVRMGGRAANERKPNWLLIKEHDEYEQPATAKPITEAKPDSVITKRTLDQIAAVEDHIWNSKDTAGTGRAWQRNDKPPITKSSTKQPTPPAAKSVVADVKKKPANKTSLSEVIAPTAAPKEALPGFIPPQLATQSTEPISSPGWLHELKLDGYRIQARKQGSSIELLTRTGLDWTHRMKTIAEQVKGLPARSLLLDGELVVLADNGTTSFADLQAAFQDGVRKPLTYFVFDILHLNGHNLRSLPLIERKAILARLLISTGEFVRLSEHIETDGATIFHKACELHAEGIVSKRATGRYSSGRSTDWLKVKCIREQEFVIGGFTLPSKSHAGMQGVGALLLGYYNDAGKLIYAGRTGTGFTQKTHAAIRTQLDRLRQPSTPFATPPAEARKDAIWIKPELVAQVRFATWTADNLVRQASFKGIREDKPAREVHKETSIAEPKQAGTRFAASHRASKPLAAKTSMAQSAATRTSASKSTPARKSAPFPLEQAPIRLTHPAKILDPLSGLTKQQLADYYWSIAPHMLPFIAHRPLSLVRCPEGSSQPCFFQKHVNHMLPPGIESVPVPDKKTGKPEAYITLSTREALAGLAQMGVLEVHPWGSRNDDLEHPDSIIFDLDPDASIEWRTLADAALEIHKRLKKVSLESFLKSTGGKGLHVVVPIKPDHNWATVKEFAHTFVRQLERDNPQLFLTTMTKSARKNRIYLDYLRNERGATAVAIFSPRARPGCPVSVPLNWAELKLPARPDCSVSNFAVWQARLKGNPWKQYSSMHQRLDPSLFDKK
jgi:bifunctional non-homologous end joining protein LigD